MDDNELHPWDRQPEEPNRWYQRFTAFRLQGVGRSLLEAANKSRDEKGIKRTVRVAGAWVRACDTWRWRDRAAAWDQFLNDQKEAEFIARQMGPDEVKAGLADIARGNLADLMDITTSGFSLELMIDDGHGNKIVNPKTKLIKKIRQKVTTYLAKSESDEDREVIETDFELYSAHDAYRDIGKIHGLFVDRSEVTVTEPVQFIEVELPPEEKDDVSDKSTD